MLDNFFDYAFPGWITGIAGLAWPTITLTGFVFAVCLLGLLFLLIKKKNKNLARPAAAKKKPSSVDHDELVQNIKALNGRASNLLFAANSFKDLPVTVPVHVAVQLAQTHTCLLIDLDTKRNAVAQAFGLDSTVMDQKLHVRSIPTEFEKLSIWPAHNFQLSKQMNFKQLIENAGGKYDYILIYAPYLTTLPDRRQIASVSKRAFAFTGTKDERLMPLLKVCNCKVIKEI